MARFLLEDACLACGRAGLRLVTATTDNRCLITVPTTEVDTPAVAAICARVTRVLAKNAATTLGSALGTNVRGVAVARLIAASTTSWTAAGASAVDRHAASPATRGSCFAAFGFVDRDAARAFDCFALTAVACVAVDMATASPPLVVVAAGLAPGSRHAYSLPLLAPSLVRRAARDVKSDLVK
jgi:hypothetical protein